MHTNISIVDMGRGFRQCPPGSAPRGPEDETRWGMSRETGLIRGPARNGYHGGRRWGAKAMGMGMHGMRASLRYQDEKIPDARERRRLFRRMFRYILPYRAQTLLIVLVLMASSAVALVPPLMIRDILDTAIPKKDLSLIVVFALTMLVAPIVGGLLSVLQNYLSAVISQRIMHTLRRDMYQRLSELSLAFFLRQRAGEMVSRLQNDVGSIQGVVVQSTTGLLSNALTLVGAFAIMLTLNPMLTLVAAVILPIFILPMRTVGRRRYEIQSRTQAVMADMASHVNETLSIAGKLLVTGFGQEKAEREKFSHLSAELRDLGVQQTLIGRWFFALVSALGTMGPAILYGIGGVMVVRGEIQVGTLVAFASYLVQLYGPTSNVVNLGVTMTASLALFNRVFDVLDQPREIREADPPKPWTGPGRVSLHHVSFAYQGVPNPALEDISAELEPGRVHALVGPSGAGKTTLMQLVARFADPTDGTILLDGTDLREIAFDDLRQGTAMVTQEPLLFHASLRANLLYGHEGVATDALLQAVSAAQLDDLLSRLPDGLETVVGERGYRLSGGEKQRVAIARAFLHNPRLLLLDEATSSLDTLAERRIQEAVDRLLERRTAIVIAHRLSTVLKAHQILVMDHGKIVDRGTHAELLERGGLYRDLYEVQFATQSEAGAAGGEAPFEEEVTSSKIHGQ